MTKYSILLLIFILSGCSATLVKQYPEKSTIYDASRDRTIPIAIYPPKGQKTHNEVVIFSHGYNHNEGSPYLGYTFLCKHLAKKGYLVISIQHEDPNDALLVKEGDPKVVRRPNWEKGVKNIDVVIDSLSKKFNWPEMQQFILIGHSNGGDMSALYSDKHPSHISKLITLDHRRYPVARVAHPQLLTLRSSDFTADEGVLPDSTEAASLGMEIVQLSDIKHNDMTDEGTSAQKAEILRHIDHFLSKR